MNDNLDQKQPGAKIRVPLKGAKSRHSLNKERGQREGGCSGGGGVTSGGSAAAAAAVVVAGSSSSRRGYRERGRKGWCELRVETSLWDGQASRGGENK